MSAAAHHGILATGCRATFDGTPRKAARLAAVSSQLRGDHSKIPTFRSASGRHLMDDEIESPMDELEADDPDDAGLGDGAPCGLPVAGRATDTCRLCPTRT
jgi:hypothetical protein